MKAASLILAVAPFIRFVSATPIIPTTPDVLGQLVDNLQASLQGTNAGITGALQSGAFQQVIDGLRQVDDMVAAPPPSSPEELAQRLQAINALKPANPFEYLANLRALNLVDTFKSLIDYAQGFPEGENSMANSNPDLTEPVYPKKLSCDAPYSVPESVLRSAIHIPPGFTHGEKPPVILFPGTGATGYTTFKGNLIPLLRGSDFADPVWVNVPGSLLDDAQFNAEFAAYAINYISALTRKNVTMVGWSQGNIDIQWAFKFWPSTRFSVSDHVAVSPDYAGTIMANLISPPGVPLPASVLQQRYMESSDFITHLRSHDGESAYVPTTTIYSGFFDEIVEPQQGTGASAFLLDARGVGVTNNEVQSVCAADLAGSFYTHEGILYNPLAFALLKDAMQNPGPGRKERIDLSSLCTQYLTPGLDLGDALVTENVIAIALFGILLHPKMFDEPKIRDYALLAPVTDLDVCNAPGATTTTTTASTTTAVTTSMTSISVIITTATSSTVPESSTTTVTISSTTLMSTTTLSTTVNPLPTTSTSPSSTTTTSGIPTTQTSDTSSTTITSASESTSSTSSSPLSTSAATTSTTSTTTTPLSATTSSSKVIVSPPVSSTTTTSIHSITTASSSYTLITSTSVSNTESTTSASRSATTDKSSTATRTPNLSSTDSIATKIVSTTTTCETGISSHPPLSIISSTKSEWQQWSEHPIETTATSHATNMNVSQGTTTVALATSSSSTLIQTTSSALTRTTSSVMPTYTGAATTLHNSPLSFGIVIAVVAGLQLI